MSHYDHRASEGVLPPRDLEAFRRAKASVDHALELRRQARRVDEPVEPQPAAAPVDQQEANNG